MQASSCMSRRASEATQASGDGVEDDGGCGTRGWEEEEATVNLREASNTFLLATNSETRYRSVVTKEVYTEKIKFYGTS
ncbi:hypothetical protein HZH66_014223 [Vespula vulgaris]|uniref:Uncharacterized protein n=1 Tax=Vespula vulgaris TaxID=7454 RepID=A0A834J593_VESVU|nr:hypothetical protein HZH66_014223 [Vespula vulgaris]